MAPMASDRHGNRPVSPQPDPPYGTSPHSSAPHSSASHAGPLYRGPSAVVITDARGAASEEVSARVRQYTWAMAFRMACFVGMIFVDGWMRWALLAFAVFLPYAAVLLANQSDQRSVPNTVEVAAPDGAPQLTTGAGTDLSGVEVIHGDVLDEPDQQADVDHDRQRRAA